MADWIRGPKPAEERSGRFAWIRQVKNEIDNEGTQASWELWRQAATDGPRAKLPTVSEPQEHGHLSYLGSHRRLCRHIDEIQLGIRRSIRFHRETLC